MQWLNTPRALCLRKTTLWALGKSARILSFFSPYFPAFGLNTKRYRVSLGIQFECGKIRTRIIPNTDIFYAVLTEWTTWLLSGKITFEYHCAYNSKLNISNFRVEALSDVKIFLKFFVVMLRNFICLSFHLFVVSC